MTLAHHGFASIGWRQDGTARMIHITCQDLYEDGCIDRQTHDELAAIQSTLM